MNEPWFPVAIVLLLALLVGFTVPALLQLRRTLRTAETFLGTTGKELDVVLREAGEAARRVNGLTEELQQNIGRVREVLDSVKDVADSARRLRDTIRTLSGIVLALGPAIFAAVQAFLARSGDESRAGTGSPPAGASEPSRAATAPSAPEEKPA